MYNSTDVNSMLVKDSGVKIKAYKKRWFILAVYSYYSLMSALQYIEYSSINNIIVKYYNVSSLAVDWTSIVYLAIYPVLIVPASHIIDSKGLRTVALIGCFGTLFGTGIKVLSINRDFGFWIVLLGQIIIAISQVFILTLPTKVAAVWFTENEVSTACSIGVIGNIVGNAVGYVIPPMIVKNEENPEDTGYSLRVLCWTLTLAMIPVCLIVLFYYPKQPTLPPSKAQAELRKRSTPNAVDMFSNLKTLFSNKAYVIHMFAYGINIGVFSGVQALLTQFILAYFENENIFAGHVGFGMTLIGIIGSISIGIFLDKTHTYKGTSTFTFFMSTVSLGALILSLEMKSEMLVYIIAVVTGYFYTAYNLAGIELAIELTFPSDEGATTGILLAMTQVMGAIITIALGYLNASAGPFWSLVSQVVIMLIGTVIQAFVPNNLLRQEFFNNGKKENELYVPVLEKKHSLHD